MNVVVLTTVHPRDDNRIFYKEVPAIASLPGHQVSAIVADGLGNESRVGYKVLDLGHTGSRLSRFLKGNWRAYRLIKKINPQVVHFHDPELMFLGLVLALSGVKIVFDVHENVPEDIKDKYWIPRSLRESVSVFYKFVEALCVRFFYAIVAATPDICDRYSSKRAVLVQNLPRLEEFSFTESDIPGQPGKGLSVAYLGAITRIRGVDNIVKSLALLGNGDQVKLKLAGFFQEAGHQKELERLPEWENVEFVGKVTRSEVGEFLSSAKAGLVTFLPANNHIKAQPNKLFEYMAAGIPVIASDFPLWRALIERYDCGYLVDPESPESIAAAIKQVRDNPEEARAKGVNGQRAIRSELNWEVESKRLVELYQRIKSEISGGS